MDVKRLEVVGARTGEQAHRVFIAGRLVRGRQRKHAGGGAHAAHKQPLVLKRKVGDVDHRHHQQRVELQPARAAAPVVHERVDRHRLADPQGEASALQPLHGLAHVVGLRGHRQLPLWAQHLDAAIRQRLHDAGGQNPEAVQRHEHQAWPVDTSVAQELERGQQRVGHARVGQ
jgi:hypothetical protein